MGGESRSLSVGVRALIGWGLELRCKAQASGFRVGLELGERVMLSAGSQDNNSSAGWTATV